MDKEQLKQLLEREDIKKDKIFHFQLKACEIVADKYGGEPSEWYYGIGDNNENSDKNKTEIKLNRIRDNRLDMVVVICEYNRSENTKVISTYKSTLPFKHIVYIEVNPEKIIIHTSSKGKSIFDHLRPIIIDNDPFEKFHKVLIKKFDQYCDIEYNTINKF